MINIDKVNYKLINIILILVLIFISFYNIKITFDLINKVFFLLMPFIIAFLISYIVNPAIKKLVLIGFNKSVSIIVIVILFISLISTFFIFVIPVIYESLFLLSKHIISFIEKITFKYSIDYEYVITSINEYFSYGSNIINFSDTLIGLILTSFNIFIQVILCFVSTIYFCFYYDKIILFINKVFSTSKFYKYLSNINSNFRLYIKSIFLIMIIEFLCYFFIFYFIGHPDYLIISIIAGFTSFIPIVGGMFTNVIAISSSFVIPNLFFKTIIVIIILPIIESYIISPLVYKRVIHINPLISIILMTLMISLFGVLGFFITIPIYIILYSVFLVYKNS